MHVQKVRTQLCITNKTNNKTKNKTHNNKVRNAISHQQCTSRNNYLQYILHMSRANQLARKASA